MSLFIDFFLPKILWAAVGGAAEKKENDLKKLRAGGKSVSVDGLKEGLDVEGFFKNG